MCGVFLLLVAATGAAQETEGEKKPPPLERAVGAVVGEVGRYLADSLALAAAPFHWDKSDAYTAIGAGSVVGGLIAADPHIYRELQNVRSDFTDRVSAATTVFGAAGGWGTAGGLLVVGIFANQQDIRDMGRDALETLVLTNVLTNVFIKPTFGRWRPNESDGTNRFDPFSGHKSFTSGHSTIAWSVASVVAMRAPGWIVPTIAYGLATVVSFNRVNDQQHFMGDVVGGAFFATAIGRFLVRRHLAERKSPVAEKEPAISIEIVPIHDGAALRLVF